MPVTLTLGLTGLVIALLVSLPLGILAAVRENTALDRVVQVVALLGQAMPSFWLGLMLMIMFGLQLGWLPISGTDSWQHYVMPGIVLAFSAIPALTRLTRAGMIQAMGSDYIRTARAKGLSRASILLKHALRNAAIPVVAIAAVQLGFMLGGSIVIEQVFALHGVGFLAWESIGKNDFPVVQAVVLVLAVIYVGAHHAGRPDERRARSEAARTMSVVSSRPAPSAAGRASAPGSARSSSASPRSAPSVAPLLVPHDPFAQDLGKRLLLPFWMEGTNPDHILGTDQLGRDYLSRLIYGCRISMMIGVTVTIVSGLIGITIGVLGGFFGGRVDDVVLFAITTRLSLPVVLVALAVVGLLGSSMTMLMITLGLLLWDRFAVVARSTTMQVRNLDFVAAAWCAGCSRFRILTRRGAAQHRQPPRRRGDARDRARHPARGGALLPRPRRAAAAAVVGPDDRRGQGLHVLQPVGDRDPGRGAVRAGARHQPAGRRPARHVRREDRSVSALLEVDQLEVSFGGRTSAVRGASFTVERGETHCLVGESGCGKSVTALAIMNLLARGARRRPSGSPSRARTCGPLATPACRGCAATPWR